MYYHACGNLNMHYSGFDAAVESSEVIGKWLNR